MYKIGQRVKVDNHNSSFPNDNKGTVVAVHMQYIVRLDGGLTGKFDADAISKLVETNKNT